MAREESERWLISNVVRPNFRKPGSDETREYLSLAQRDFRGTDLVVSLGSLGSFAGAAQVAGESGIGAGEQYTAGHFLFSFEPAVLIPIDGEAVSEAVGGRGVEKAHQHAARAAAALSRVRFYLGYGGPLGERRVARRAVEQRHGGRAGPSIRSCKRAVTGEPSTRIEKAFRRILAAEFQGGQISGGICAHPIPPELIVG